MKYNIICIVKALLQTKYPREYKDEWIANSSFGDMYFKRYQDRRRWVYTDDKGIVNYKPGDLMPLIENGKKVAYYKVIGYRRKEETLPGWNDGRHYNLKLYAVA